MTRLLIIKPSSLGDIVHGLQVAATLQAGRPDLRIDWVAADRFAPLVRRVDGVRRVHVFARRGGVRGWWRLWRGLRAESYDMVFDFQGLQRSAWMTAAARARLKVGRTDAREGAGWAYHRRVPLPPEGARSHAVDVLLQFAPVLGLPPVLAGRVGFGSRPWPAGAPVLPPGTLVLFPESRRPEKCWPHFAALTERLLAADPTTRVAWAGAGPVAMAVPPAGPRGIDLTGRTPLEALPEVIGAARLVVANDSGPAHLAAALGVPVLALFGPTDPQRFRPYPASGDGRGLVRVLAAPAGDLARLRPETVAEAIVGWPLPGRVPGSG